MKRRLAVLTAILLLGTALRLRGLGAMNSMAHYDEAYYAVDALSLLKEPRLTPFFPDNFGRESLWMYLLAPSLAVFGAGSFGMRIVAVFTGVLTLAAVYRLARELVGTRGAVWSMAALAALFWHVLASHEAFRALLFPLVGALAFAFLWQAHRTQRLCLWVVGGILFGLLFYTYLAARLWLVLGALTLAVWFLCGQRRGTLVAGLIAGAIGLPLLIYLATQPVTADQRLEQVAISDMGVLVNNIAAWLRVPFIEGPQDVIYNLPGRPLLDVPLALLLVAGVAALFRMRRAIQRDCAVWLIGLVGASLVPALLTTEPLRWLRAIGLVVPLAILLGAGAEIVERALGEIVARRGDLSGRSYRITSAILPALLLVFAGGDTLRDFDRWVSSPDLFMPMEQHIYGGIDWLAANSLADARVYFTPFTPDHPVLRLRQWRLGERPAGAFLPAQCLALSLQPAYYLSIPMFLPGFAEQLGSYASVESVKSDDPRYTIYRAEPHASLPDDWTTFGARIAAENVNPLPDAARTGDTIELTMAFRRVGAVDRPYTLFAHLSREDAAGAVTLIGQDDEPICASYPPSLWRVDETIIQRYAIAVDTAAQGEFTISIGIYDSVTLEQLPIDEQATIEPIHSLRIN